MTNPFADLGKEKQVEEAATDYELIGGSLTCQSSGCWAVVHEGKYFASELLLTWICPEGHISHVKDIEL